MPLPPTTGGAHSCADAGIEHRNARNAAMTPSRFRMKVSP
jgi:hypothetical protein